MKLFICLFMPTAFSFSHFPYFFIHPHVIHWNLASYSRGLFIVKKEAFNDEVHCNAPRQRC